MTANAMPPIRVLLADDHPVLRKGIRTILEMEDDITVVAEAGDGEEALRLVQETAPDVLVLDVSMPKKSGLDVIKALTAQQVDTHILVLSAYDDENFITEMIEAGAAGYLLKREALETIVEAVRGVSVGETGWFSKAIIEKIIQQAQKQPSTQPKLTEREKEILQYLAQGWKNVQIANKLNISERTVRYHLRNIYDKVGADSRGMAIAWGVRHGFGKSAKTE
jgi:DNA-binding NarL/FixJ family response regulator